MMVHSVNVLRKLIERAGNDESLTTLVTIALERLPYQQDERIASQLLSSILFHDNLVEALNGHL